jgi:hypothetical protein
MDANIGLTAFSPDFSLQKDMLQVSGLAVRVLPLLSMKCTFWHFIDSKYGASGLCDARSDFLKNYGGLTKFF